MPKKNSPGRYGNLGKTWEEIYAYAGEGHTMLETAEFCGAIYNLIYLIYRRKGIAFNGSKERKVQTRRGPYGGRNGNSTVSYKTTIIDMSFDNDTLKYKGKCACCGESYYAVSPMEYAYKRQQRHQYYYGYCSWKCLRRDEKEREEMFRK